MHAPEDPLVGGHPPLLGIAISLAGLAACTLLVLLVQPLREAIGNAASGDTDALRDEIDSLGVGGALIVLALAVLHAFVWYPAEILDAAAGFAFGFWAALPLVMAGWLLNLLVCWWIGRHAARPLLFRVFGRERFLGYERVIERGGITLLLAMRLVPIVPFSLFSYVAGSARVPLPRLIWTTAVGYLPLTALFVYLGSRLEELSLNDPLVWLGAIVLIALLLLTHRLRGLLRAQEAD
jgi:uncharacterized membrane protein YdjX (TVP38/TMEM64 family)